MKRLYGVVQFFFKEFNEICLQVKKNGSLLFGCSFSQSSETLRVINQIQCYRIKVRST